MATSSKSSINMNPNRRVGFPDLDRMRAFGQSSFVNQDYHDVPLPSHYLNSTTQNISNNQSMPPPLPPRSDISRNNRFSSYNSPYFSPYSRFSPSMYSGFGGYRTPYSRYGVPPDSYNSFIQLAEESTRPAFESIESVVDIVGSISMMLESTYHAVYSSYNAILGVVDQFSRLKDHLAEVLSILAVLRGLRYLCLKILYLLKLRKDNPSVEAAWRTATSAAEHSEFSPFQSDPKSPWPIFMFVGLVIGAPWLMFKLLSRSMGKKSSDIRSWEDKNGFLICIGNYDFNTNRRGEICFKAGEQLLVAPKHLQASVPKGWMLACNRNKQIGLIPRNYLKAQMFSSQKKTKPVGNNSKVEQVQVVTDKSTDFSKIDPVNPFAPEDDVPSVPENEPTSSNVEDKENEK